MKLDNLNKLYIEELRDLYSAENQLVSALPKMAKAATSTQLQRAFEQHLDQTKGHVARLEEIFKSLDTSPRGKKCKGMEGLIEEGEEHAKEDGDDDTLDAALIASAQRVEHYEIAGYGTVQRYATLLGHDKDARVLQSILDEEYQADTLLNQIAETINVEAMAGSGSSKKSR